MKFILNNPATGKTLLKEIEDERVLQKFMDKRMGTDVDGADLGAEYTGMIFRIAGGNDKQGFPMMQGVVSANRVRLLFSKGMKTFRERRKGSRKRKSVRGCITDHDLAVLCLNIISVGKCVVAGLTDEVAARRKGPKRATKIRKMFGLAKEDDVRKYVVRRKIESDGKTRFKAPKIQRLITPQTLQRKRHIRNSKVKKVQAHRADKKASLARKTQWFVEQREKRASEAMKKKEAVAKKK